MKYEIKKKVSPHSYVHLLGFLYPIRFDKDEVGPLDFRDLVDELKSEFGEPCRNWHFAKGYGTTRYERGFASIKPKELRWIAGSVNWNARGAWSTGDRHVVFRTEQDRTWARILIGK
jgi:hypothetical protein